MISTNFMVTVGTFLWFMSYVVTILFILYVIAVIACNTVIAECYGII